MNSGETYRMNPVIMDVDPGVDEALAIILALCAPELAVEGISVVNGNVLS